MLFFHCTRLTTVMMLLALGIAAPAVAQETGDATIRIGLIGLDTSHSTAFTKLLNGPNPAPEFAGCRITVAYPWGSRDIESSTSRIPEYTEEVKKYGVEIVDSIDALVAACDAVLLETNDGRPHLEQVIPVLKAGKRVFVDKPIAGSLADTIAIFAVSRKTGTPLFSSSSLRYMADAQSARAGKFGDVLGCEAHSPCSLEATHPSLYWYGIHGVEILYTVMGPGCDSVVRASTKDTDVAVGVWADGRIGTFRGTRAGKHAYGGTVFGTTEDKSLGGFSGYAPLMVEIVKFFRTGEVPIDPAETVELYAFMEAADESLRNGGAPVRISDVMAKAKTQADARLAELLKQ